MPDGRRLGEADLGPGDPPHLAAEAEFADDRAVARHRPIARRPGDGEGDREIGPGIGQADAAGDVDEDVQLRQRRCRRAWPGPRA